MKLSIFVVPFHLFITQVSKYLQDLQENILKKSSYNHLDDVMKFIVDAILRKPHQEFHF